MQIARQGILPLYAQKAKEEGISKAEANHAEAIKTARSIAYELARVRGRISVEDVRQAVSMRGINIFDGKYKNWMGGIFRGKEWVPVDWVPATHPEANGRPVRVWELRAS